MDATREQHVHDIWLIRHGESVANAGQITSDPARSELTAKGRAQAEAVCALYSRAPQLIVRSPYLRAAATAKPAQRAFPDAAVETWPVQEFTYLAPVRYQGTTGTQRKPHLAAYWERLDPQFRDQGRGESFAEAFARVREFFERAAQRRGLVAVYTHGKFMRLCMWQALVRPRQPDREAMRSFMRFNRAVPTPNCCRVALFQRDGAWFTGPVERAHLDQAGPGEQS